MVGGAQCGISLGMDESTVWCFEQGEVQVGMKSEQNVRAAEISDANGPARELRAAGLGCFWASQSR